MPAAPLRVLCAPNAFKGAADALTAARAIAGGVLRQPGTRADPCPVADGGDGTLDVLLAARPASRIERRDVSGPLGTRVPARLGWLDATTAVVELAEASGLRLLGAPLPDPSTALRAGSRGCGELIVAALEGGARRILVGLGGSACSDAGAGLLAALGVTLEDAAGAPLAPGGGALTGLERADARGLHPGLRRCRVEVACDVDAPLLGALGAARAFARQKGAGAAEVRRLEAGHEHLAAVLERHCGAAPAVRGLAGAGAAGGCGYALAALCGARLVRGAALVCAAVGLDRRLRAAGLVITGEGSLDRTTLAGKAPAEVAARARRAGVPCVALAGRVDPGVPASMFDEVVELGAGLELADSMRRTATLLADAAQGVVARRAPARRA